jgi:hypothetical protein
MARVTGLNITPVKSTALLRPDAVSLSADGAVGDRRFLFVRDDGSRPSGISKAPLLRVVSRYDIAAERLSLRFPDGELVTADASARDHARPVKLYDREVMARDVDPAFSEAARDLIDPTLTLLRVEEPEYAGGQRRVSLVSRESVAKVGSWGGDSALDPRRFRMLIEIEGLQAFEEDSWAGRAVRIGEATVRIGRQMGRCVMTTLHPETGVNDFPTLDVLARHRKVGDELVLGVHGDVEAPGMIKVGDAVSVLSDTAGVGGSGR